TAFELIYGYFTEPRIEDDIFQCIITSSFSMISNQASYPNFVFRKAVLDSLYDVSLRRMRVSEDGIKRIDKERAIAIYKERFADASDFVFTIVGSFTEEEMQPYLENYLAALPVSNRKEQPKDLALYEPEQGFEKVVRKGQEEKANVM